MKNLYTIHNVSLWTFSDDGLGWWGLSPIVSKPYLWSVIGNLYRQIGLRSIWQTFRVRLWKKTKYRSNIIEVFPSSVLSRRQSMTIFCATFTHLHLCCLKKSMSFSGVRYPIWFNSISNFAKKWFIQYLIQYCFTQDSLN